MGDSRSDNRIYIGNLPPDIRNKDLEDLFYKYGKIRYIDLKNKRGPPFAFIEFDDSLDAEDSIKGRDGYNFDGYRLRVELQKGPRNNGPSGGGRGGGYGDRRGGPPTRRSEYRCIISGLPPTGSWQDIKDHMRVAGNVCYADVFKDGTGVCEFIRYDDMKYAVKHLDDTKFRSHEGETSYITVKSDYHRSRRSMSRSYSRSRSRSYSSPRRKSGRALERERASPSYSPARRSRSRSRSHEDRRRAKKSYSRSRSRSRSPKRANRRNRSESRTRSRSHSPKKQRSFTKSRSRSDRSMSAPREQQQESSATNGVENPPNEMINEKNSVEHQNGTTD